MTSVPKVSRNESLVKSFEVGIDRRSTNFSRGIRVKSAINLSSLTIKLYINCSAVAQLPKRKPKLG